MEKFLFGLVSWSWPRPVAGQVTAPDLQQSRVMEGRRCPHAHNHTTAHTHTHTLFCESDCCPHARTRVRERFFHLCSLTAACCSSAGPEEETLAKSLRTKAAAKTKIYFATSQLQNNFLDDEDE